MRQINKNEHMSYVNKTLIKHKNVEEQKKNHTIVSMLFMTVIKTEQKIKKKKLPHTFITWHDINFYANKLLWYVWV